MASIALANGDVHSMYDTFSNLTGVERELAILSASWDGLFGSVPVLRGLLLLFLPAINLFVITPLLLLFFFGKWMTGHGGGNIYEICEKNSGHPASFWTHDEMSRERCSKAVATEFASYLTTILVPVYFTILAWSLMRLSRFVNRVMRRSMPRRLRDLWTDTPPKCPSCQHLHQT